MGRVPSGRSSPALPAPQSWRTRTRCLQVRCPGRALPRAHRGAGAQTAPHLLLSPRPGFENSSLLTCNCRALGGGAGARGPRGEGPGVPRSPCGGDPPPHVRPSLLPARAGGVLQLSRGSLCPSQGPAANEPFRRASWAERTRSWGAGRGRAACACGAPTAAERVCSTAAGCSRPRTALKSESGSCAPLGC